MNQLLVLDSELEEDFKQKFINTNHKVIIETTKGEFLVGHTSNYLEILIPFEEEKIGKMLDVKIIKCENGVLYGVLI